MPSKNDYSGALKNVPLGTLVALGGDERVWPKPILFKCMSLRGYSQAYVVFLAKIVVLLGFLSFIIHPEF